MVLFTALTALLRILKILSDKVNEATSDFHEQKWFCGQGCWCSYVCSANEQGPLKEEEGGVILASGIRRDPFALAALL